MNFNASRNVGHGGGVRKAKRVSDVAAVGAPTPTPMFNPGQAFSGGMSSGYPTEAPPPYSEGAQFQTNHFGTPQPAPVQQGYAYPSGFGGSPAQIGSMLQQPVVQDMALQYGSQLAAQGREAVSRELHRFVPVSTLRYYFAVDTRYVIKKLLLILFPFTNSEWTVKYERSVPVQPRYDLNAPDLYIPYMGYVSYVLLAGFLMGVQQRFSPEQLGILASGALAYMVCEVGVYASTLYVTNTQSALRALDLLAYCGYKYCGMLVSLAAGLLLGPSGYYCCLIYTSLALTYFLIKTLRVIVMSGPMEVSEPSPYGYGYEATQGARLGGGAGGLKRRVNFLLCVGLAQPVLAWWLTYHLVPAAPVLLAPPAPA